MSQRKQSSTALGRILAVKDMTFQELSKKTGIGVQRLYNLASGGAKSRRARKRVESALGLVIWPKPDTANTATTEASR